MSSAAAQSRQRLRAIVRKEWLDLRRNRTVLGTLLFLPMLLTLVSTGMLLAAARSLASAAPPGPNAAAKVPEFLRHLTDDPRQAALLMLAHTALMMFSMVPVLLPSIMAAHSIVGEKLARSLEPLLATPLATWELLVGKLIAILAPSLVPSLLGYAIYVGVAVAAAPPSVVALVTSPPFVLTIVLVGPLAAVLAVTFGMMVSARSADLQSAQGLAGLIVLPVIGIGMAQMFGALSVSVTAALVKALVLLVLDGGALLLCISVFERETILSRWK